MGADVIQANYEELEAIAARFGQWAENNADMSSQIRQGVEKLMNGDWIGKGSEAFFKEMSSEVLPALDRLTYALEQSQEIVRQIIIIVQQAEEEASAVFQNGIYSQSSSDGLFRTSPTPKQSRPLTPEQATLVQVLGAITVAMDIVVTSISSASALAEVGLVLVDGPAPLGDLAAAIGYYTVINPLENMFSTIGFGSTALSDMIQGNTYIDSSTQELVIGQDTLVSGTGLLLGNALPLEGIGDTIINTSILTYDVRGLSGNPVTFGGRRWELRIGTDEAYFVGYPPASEGGL